MTTSEERRCSAGCAEEPTDCDRHPKHYFCTWCEGWYGVPHDFGCHTQSVRRDKYMPGVGRSDPKHCACRYCEVSRKFGWEFAEKLLRSKKP